MGRTSAVVVGVTDTSSPWRLPAWAGLNNQQVGEEKRPGSPRSCHSVGFFAPRDLHLGTSSAILPLICGLSSTRPGSVVSILRSESLVEHGTASAAEDSANQPCPGFGNFNLNQPDEPERLSCVLLAREGSKDSEFLRFHPSDDSSVCPDY